MLRRRLQRAGAAALIAVILPSPSPSRLEVRLAAVRCCPNGVTQLAVVKVGGSTHVTNGPANLGGPSWSPDGNRIVVTRSRVGELPDLVVLSPRGEVVSALTRTEEAELGPDWGTTGLIAFARAEADSSWLYILDPRTGGETRLVEGEDPSWSPEGDRLAFSWEGTISILDIDSGDVSPFTSGLSPAWSPDGKTIAYRMLVGETYQVMSIRLCGGTPDQLTNSSRHNGPPSWSPDGSHLAFDRFFDDEPRGRSFHILAIPRTGGKPRLLGYGATPDWSPLA